MQVVTKALQLHPREASLWIYASAWEFEHNRNAGAARALMQRGLRMCPGKAEVWAEYFRMELLYAHTLRTRRKVLGIAPAGVWRACPWWSFVMHAPRHLSSTNLSVLTWLCTLIAVPQCS